MPKSVDETVFDYFSTLLSEPVAASSEALAMAQKARTPEKEKAPENVQDTPARVAEPSRTVLDKAALQQLLAPVMAGSNTIAAETAPKVELAPAPAIISSSEAIIAQAENCPYKVPEDAPALSAEGMQADAPPAARPPLAELLDDEFQVLFFKVAGLTLAVPLLSLGGIVQIAHINHIIGRPQWYKGVQNYRGTQLNVVDTARWVMPEKYHDNLAQPLNYQYVVVLENSNWGLACEALVNTVKVNKSQVSWRGAAGKRPWLAGVVKEQMCGILHVRALIEMLNAGLGCQDPID
ncbi:chemotaxis protein CheW [Shewanella sp. YIC-542]|uniref:chemotaxis protein CheW n=1 Tax=Shewanella mytili TaxID=3377111 RepID=UPI00398F2F30